MDVELTPRHPGGLATEIVLRCAQSKARLVIITGGEPLLWAKRLVPLVRLLPKDYRVEIETNGTLKPTADLHSAVSRFVVSPKLSGSGNPTEKALVPDALLYFASSLKSVFKFVVGSPEELNEVLHLLVRFNICRSNVWVMPEGATTEAQMQKLPWLFEEAQKHAFNLSPRLQTLAFGNKRGV